jgi:hypothetical protein
MPAHSDTGDAPTSHRLDVLFRQLKHKRKRRAEELWNEHCRPKIEHQARHFGNPIDLPNAIVACGDAFERLRYHYEDPQKTLYYLDELPWVLGQVILEIKPEWHQPAPALQDRVAKT